MKHSFITRILLSGPLLITIACFLMATDSIVRSPSVEKIDPVLIVITEHILAVLLMFPWIALTKHRHTLFSLSRKEWFCAVYSGGFGSGLGLVFYTMSFSYTNPSFPLLIQQLQPVFVVLIAYLFLREVPQSGFYFWGAVAILSASILTFPDFSFDIFSQSSQPKTLGAFYALLATFLWGSSTVSGKYLLKRTPVAIATFWRFFFGLITLSIFILFRETTIQWTSLSIGEISFPLLYLSLISGLIPMIIYYQGLQNTPANVTTFIELTYPIGGVALNFMFLDAKLRPIEIVSGCLLIYAILKICLNDSPKSKKNAEEKIHASAEASCFSAEHAEANQNSFVQR